MVILLSSLSSTIPGNEMKEIRTRYFLLSCCQSPFLCSPSLYIRKGIVDFRFFVDETIIRVSGKKPLYLDFHLSSTDCVKIMAVGG